MFQIVNNTRLAAALAPGFNHEGAETLCVAAKGTFAIPQVGESLRFADEQIAPLSTNVYYGEPGESSLKYPCDLVPGRIATDVLLIGTARSPFDRPVRRLDASLRVGALEKRVRVIGDRRWEKRGLGSVIVTTEPEPFTEMPVVYERAYGGVERSVQDESDPQWDPRNPVGTGFVSAEDAVDGTSLPNIEDPDNLVSSWESRPPIAGFGAIDASWEPRSLLGGTYDEEWASTQAPLPPGDIHPEFFNVAPSGLVAAGFLTGGESVELINFSEEGRLAFRLPRLDIVLSVDSAQTQYEITAQLWMVLFEPDDRRFSMIWGDSFVIGKQPSHVRSVTVDAYGDLR
jgi:hypothetical protein